MKYVRFVIGALLVLIGAVFFAVSVVALVDPVSTKMADDNDPFGTPPPWYAAALGAVISGGVAAGGILLVRRKANADERAA